MHIKWMPRTAFLDGNASIDLLVRSRSCGTMSTVSQAVWYELLEVHGAELMRKGVLADQYA